VFVEVSSPSDVNEEVEIQENMSDLDHDNDTCYQSDYVKGSFSKEIVRAKRYCEDTIKNTDIS